MQPNLIVFDKKVKIFILLMVVGFIVSIMFKLHGLSINMWDDYLPSQKYKSENILIGKAQGIRSDEWLVSTPFILSQIQHDFPIRNLNIGVENTPLLVHYNLPVYHFISLFKPQNYAYFFLGYERGFSFMWNYKVFGLIFSSFLLLMLFTQNNFLLSLLGSVLVYLSSFNQWWFSIPLPDLIIAFNMIVVLFTYFIYSTTPSKIIVYAFGVIYFFINFAIILYPPFQVPLGYLALLLMGIILFEYYKNKKFDYIFFKASTTVILVVLTGVLFYYFYLDVKDVIDIILQTEYPGNRVVSGGGVDIARYFSGYYDFFYSSSRFPLSFGNVCESSNFFFLFPFFIPFLFISLFKKSLKIDYKIWLLLLYILFISIWIFWGFSPTIAHITLFEKVQPTRALLGLGIANIIITMVFVNWLQKQNNIEKHYTIEFYVAIFFVLFMLGKLMQASNIFYTDMKIIISSVIFTFVIYTIFTKKIKLFTLSIFLVAVPSFFANPLVSGMPQFKEKELVKFIESSSFDDGLWIAYDNIAAPMYLKAIGLNVINGVNFIPNLERSKVLNPDGKYKNIYNRYAHIVVKTSFSEMQNIKYNLVQSDHYEIFINPCNEKLKLLGIKYFVFASSYRKKINDLKECNIHLINDKPLNNFDIYERLN